MPSSWPRVSSWARHPSDLQARNHCRCLLGLNPSLIAAALYNLAWGAFVVLFPAALFKGVGIPEPTYPAIWQCVGMIVGVYGVAYALAATDPARHWPIVLVGLLGKVLGPIGFVLAAMGGELPWRFGITIIFNDLVWWVPLRRHPVARLPREPALRIRECTDAR